MSLKILFLLVLLILMIACGQPFKNRPSPTNTPGLNQSPAKTGSFDRTLSSGGVTRHYILQVPPMWDFFEAHPMPRSTR